MPWCPSLKSVCHGAILDLLVANDLLAVGMYNQIDVLSAPGAGLRHLDFSMSPMFQTYFPADGSPSSVQMEPMPSPMNTTQCFVRTYGSEPEM